MNMRWKTVAAVLHVIWVGASLRAAESGLQFGHLTIEDGLSQNWVLSILKDSQGFLWFGTQDGLNRYDGVRFKVYRHDPNDPKSLPSSVAGALYEDAQKRLWIGSHQGNAGVALYEREYDRFRRFLPNPGQPVGNSVRVIVQDAQGRIWLGTDNGLAKLDPDTGTIRRFPLSTSDRAGVPEALVVSLLEDSRGRFWVGTSRGLLRFDREHERYIRWPGEESDRAGLHRADVWAIHEGEDGRLWIGTLGSGLHRLDPQTGRDVRYLPDPRNPRSIRDTRVSRIVSGGHGKLYVGTENGGLYIFDVRRDTFLNLLPDIDDDTSLNSKSIWSLYRDEQSTLWIGTFNGGVNYLSPYLRRFQRIRAGRGKLSDPHVSAVLEDHQGTVWIGTDGGGLNRLEARTGAFTYYRSDPNDPTTIGSDAVWALLEDSRLNLWLGGWDGGLGLLDRATGRVKRYRFDPSNPRSLVSNHVWRIVELSTGELLVITQAGADLFDRDTGTFTRLADLYPGAGEDVLYSAAEDGQGNLWLVGNSFVGHVDRRTRRVTRYRHDPRDPRSLGLGWTQAVLIDSGGNAWFGTQGGLSCLEAASKQWVRYTTADGLSSDTVVGIVEDASGSLWVSTSRGLDEIVDAIRVPRKPEVYNFDAHDGLQSQEFARNAAFRSSSERLYFGGAQGLNAFEPERVVPNPQPPKVVLADLRIFNESVRPGAAGSPLTKSIGETRALTLSPEHSVVTFEFAALSYVLPRKNKYAYMLQGFDRQWSYVGTQRTATYTNLPRGKEFTFRVKASNNDGVWNEEGVSLKVYVTPRWYERWVTWILAAGLLVAAALGVYRLRMIEVRSRYSAVLKERNRLAREMHDTLAQNLGGVAFQLDAIKMEYHDIPVELRRRLDQTSKMIRFSLAEAYRAIRDLRASALETHDLATAITEIAERAAAESGIDVHVDVDGPMRRLSAIVENNLLRIVQEAVTNAVKHSGAQKIDVELRYHQDRLTLGVRDDGRGVPMDKAFSVGAGHYGLLGMRERADRIGGHLALESNNGAGTAILVELPIESS